MVVGWRYTPGHRRRRRRAKWWRRTWLRRRASIPLDLQGSDDVPRSPSRWWPRRGARCMPTSRLAPRHKTSLSTATRAPMRCKCSGVFASQLTKQCSWVPSSACSSCASTSNRFTTSKSSTFAYIDGASNVQTITYGTGAVQGVPANETVTWGGYTSVAQPFLLVTAEDSVMAAQMLGTGDGIMGLAYSEGLSRATSDTILSGLAAHAQLPADFFSLWFNQSTTSLSSSSTPYGGLLILGEIDSSLYTGDFSYASLVPSDISTTDGSSTSIIYYWSVEANTISVSGGASISPPSGTIVIVDSGTTLIVLDSATIETLIASLKKFATLEYSTSSEIYYTSCTAAANLPAITFMLGGNGVSYTLTASQYVISDGQECVLGIQSSGSTSAEWVFGEVFLSNYYAVFDFTNKRVGFAVAAGSTVLASTDASVITDTGSVGSGESTGSGAATTTSGSKSSFAERSVYLTTICIGPFNQVY
ncbi:hypothetical protein HK100_000125 [Physocladia obscura]|uniref:Peptidase A1 domain-containing protein n=1 Tax=Physocladia obscura TaxID=109957 RepID=A0AAD5XH65_9FUNG|nr:hypothetical protein HK100_000125 [Physocladia obscura]